VKLDIVPRSQRHREEVAKLTATLINGAAIACLIGATFGPWLNSTLHWGWNSIVLFIAAGLIHIVAQIVLAMGFERTLS
jgi:MFS family permease